MSVKAPVAAASVPPNVHGRSSVGDFLSVHSTFGGTEAAATNSEKKAWMQEV